MKQTPIHFFFHPAAFALALTSAAFFGSSCVSSEPVLHEVKVFTLSPAESVAWKTTIASRAAAIEDCTVLDRLSAEETGEIQEATERLKSKFGIDPTRSYSYHAETLSIVETAVTTEGQRVELPHRKFSTSEEADAFVSLVTEKQEAANRLSMLRGLREAKESRRSACDAFLRRTFQIDPSVAYRFDEETRILWKPVSSKEWERARAEEKAKAEAERKAKIAAAEKARAEEKAKAEAERKAKIAAAEKARAEEKAKIEAERKARDAAIRAERESIISKKNAERAAKEKARADELAKREAEKEARESAERKAKQARADAIKAEETALAKRIADTMQERLVSVNKAQRMVSEASRAEKDAVARLETARLRLKEAKASGRTPDTRIQNLKLGIEIAEDSVDQARLESKTARCALSDAEQALSRADKDARKTFYDDLRAQGKKPLTEPGGFFSWF